MTIKKEKTLLDTFQVTSDNTTNSLEEFEKTVKEMDEITDFFHVNTENISVLSQVNGEYYVNLDGGNVLGTVVDKACEYKQMATSKKASDPSAWKKHTNTVGSNIFSSLLKSIVKVEDAQFLSKGDFRPLIEEIANGQKLLLYDGSKVYAVSDRVPSDFCLVDIKGDFVASPGLARDVALSTQFAKLKKNVTLVTRTINGVTKLFALRSGRYTPIPQAFIMDIIKSIAKLDPSDASAEKMGKPVVNSWHVNHQISGIFIEFPEKAQEYKDTLGLKDDFVPGLYLATSDTGDSSITIYETWRLKKSISFHKEIKQIHSGNVSLEELMQKIKVLFSEYRTIPTALCNLMLLDVTPDSLDLSDAHAQITNKTIIDCLLEEVFKKLNILKAIGLKRRNALLKAVQDCFDPSTPYAAYDIAMQVLDLPISTIGMNDVTLRELQKAVGGVVFLDFKKLIKDAIEESTSSVVVV